MAAITLADLNQALAVALTPVNGQLTLLREDVAILQADLSAISITNRIILAKMENGTKGRTEALTRVPKRDGSDVNPNVEYLQCVEQLLVAGNERLSSGDVNGWNSDKSLLLIREYDPGYDTDGIDSEDKKSRRRCMVLAKHLGVSSAQLNLAQINLASY